MIVAVVLQRISFASSPIGAVREERSKVVLKG
jgi:hypothetical protein